MGNCYEKPEEFTIVKHEKDPNLKQYVKQKKINFYNIDNLIDKENKEDLICPICFFVLNNPKSCTDKNNSHSFCKGCIDDYLKNTNKCPTCKTIFEYKINTKIIEELNKLKFQCEFKNKGCNNILSY